LEQALRSFGTSKDELEKIAILNGMALDASVERGMLLKTIERH
jgi:hypothetical protein